MHLTETHDLVYLPGDGAPSAQHLDVYRPAADGPPGPGVLLWHGIGPDEKDVLATLAREVASHGLPVFVPDWRSDEPDGGSVAPHGVVAVCPRPRRRVRR